MGVDSGDLLTQPGAETLPLTRGDILGPSEASRRRGGDYDALTRNARSQLERLAALGV